MENNKDLDLIRNSEQAKKLIDSIRQCGVVSELTLDDLDTCSGGVASPDHTHVWTGKQYLNGSLKNLKCACGEKLYEAYGEAVDLKTFCQYMDILKENLTNLFEENV